MVGTSAADCSALAFVRKLTKDNQSFFFAPYTIDVANFLEKVATSIIPAKPNRQPRLSWLKSKYIDIRQLAKFLRECPPELLNSKRIADNDQPETLVFSRLITESQLAKRQAI